MPEIAFAGGFQEEEAFKDSSAGSFPTGLFGYRYVNPLTAPNGTKYETGSSEDMINAIEAGDVYLAPILRRRRPEARMRHRRAGIRDPHRSQKRGWRSRFHQLDDDSPEQNAAYVIGPGGGFPTLKAIQAADDFQTTFYEEAAEAIGASDCTPWYGSLARPNEAQDLVMTTIYKLIKEDPDADIAEALVKTQEEYNANN